MQQGQRQVVRQILWGLGHSEWAEALYLRAPVQTGEAHFQTVLLTHCVEEAVNEGVASEGTPLFQHL